MRVPIVALACMVSAGCALIDGAGGDPTDPPGCLDPAGQAIPCRQLTCQDPFVAGFPDGPPINVEVCQQRQLFAGSACGPPEGEDAVIRLFFPAPGDYTICFDSGPAGTLTLSEVCDASIDVPGTCIGRGECRSTFIGEPEALLLWRGDFPDTCDSLTFTFFSGGGPMPAGVP